MPVINGKYVAPFSDDEIAEARRRERQERRQAMCDFIELSGVFTLAACMVLLLAVVLGLLKWP